MGRTDGVTKHVNNSLAPIRSQLPYMEEGWEREKVM